MDQYRSRLKLSETFERHWSIRISVGIFIWTPIIGPYLFLGKFVWTNGPESSSKVSPYTAIGPWMALPSSAFSTDASSGKEGGQRHFSDSHEGLRLRSRPGKPNQRKGQNPRFSTPCEMQFFPREKGKTAFSRKPPTRAISPFSRGKNRISQGLENRGSLISVPLALRVP